MQTTPYDVLGVRPGARGDEIEYAYRGRRSQYHPDRYAQADAETQAWATQKMQELNQAYAALKSGSNANVASPTSARTEQSAPALDGLKVLLQEKIGDGSWNKVYVGKAIPPKKLSGALGSYAEGVHPSKILALLDNTLFGGAKEGLVLFEEGVRFKVDPGNSVRSFAFTEIETIQWDRSKLYINSREVAKFALPDDDACRYLFQLVNECLEASGSSAADSNSRQTPREESGNHGRKDDIETLAKTLTACHRLAVEAVVDEGYGTSSGEDQYNFEQCFNSLFRAVAPHVAHMLDNAIEIRVQGGPRIGVTFFTNFITTLGMLYGLGLAAVPADIRTGMGSIFNDLLDPIERYAEEFIALVEDSLGEELELQSDYVQANATLFASAGRSESELEFMGHTVLGALRRVGLSDAAAKEIVEVSIHNFIRWASTHLSTFAE